MKKQKAGIVLLWIGIIGLLVNYFSTWYKNTLWKSTTPETVVGTGWGPGEFLFNFTGMMTVVGIGLSIIGALLYTGKEDSKFWLWGFLPLIIFPIFSLIWQPSQSIPVVYGIGGGIITFAYIGVLWIWVKTHTAFDGIAKTGKNIQLLGYSFLYITSLLLCTYIGQPNLPAMEGQPTPSSYSILISFSIGWVLLSVGYYLSGKEYIKQESQN